jgi:hypothetical protein
MTSRRDFSQPSGVDKVILGLHVAVADGVDVHVAMGLSELSVFVQAPNDDCSMMSMMIVAARSKDFFLYCRCFDIAVALLRG